MKGQGLPTSNVIPVDIKQPNILTFGDTIILTWETAKRWEGAYIECLEPCISKIIPLGIANGLLLRGAISVGKYIETTDSTATVLGPAIRDAAFWYEEVQWIGIIATPKCGLVIEHESSLDRSWSKSVSLGIDSAWVKYNVELKENNTKKLYAVNWSIAFDEIKNTLPYLTVGSLANALSKMDIPKGTEDKYYNTINFYNSQKILLIVYG